MSYGALLNFVWRAQMLDGQAFTGVAGERIEVVSTGEEAPETDTQDGLNAASNGGATASSNGGIWLGAEIVVDGERRRGTAMIGNVRREVPGAVLRVVTGYETPMLGSDGELIPQIAYSIDSQAVELYDGLRKGAATKACAERIAKLDELRRAELLTALLVRRLQRKTARIEATFRRTNKDWNQTFWVLLLEVMGGNRNREAYSELAARLKMVTVSREKASAQTVDNLIVGAAGLLENDDEKAVEEFAHLAAKHSIVPLRAGEWDTTKIMPVNHPRNRLRQVAALVSKTDFMLDCVLDCLNSDDVEALFALPSPPPGVPLSRSAGRLGAGKARLIGINLVAPLMFAYGKETGREELCERALDVLATTPAESNVKLNAWYSRGCVARDAFESQALLELSNEFCDRAACAECRFGRKELSAILKRMPIFVG